MNNKVNEKGRPSKYDEKTVTVGMRVPISKVDDFKAKAEMILLSYRGTKLCETIKKVKAEMIDIDSKCNCKLLGSSPTGKEIWQRCSTHKNIK